MAKLVLHQHTERQLQHFAGKPAHAVLLSGQSGIGKGTVALHLAAQLLGVEPDKLLNYPHLKRIVPEERKAIGIEVVRELEHFLSLKVPSRHQPARAVIIEDAHLLSHEAQNALLKTLEEPPTDTVLILTASYIQALLPTIRSRTQAITVQRPPVEELTAYFNVEGQALERAIAVSGGLPGLTATLLDGDGSQPLMEAVNVVRELLQQPAYARLLKVDELAKRKDFCRDMCYVFMQMAQMALERSNGASLQRWQAILKAAYEADEQLAGSAQPKLVLAKLMLTL